MELGENQASQRSYTCLIWIIGREKWTWERDMLGEVQVGLMGGKHGLTRWPALFPKTPGWLARWRTETPDVSRSSPLR